MTAELYLASMAVMFVAVGVLSYNLLSGSGRAMKVREMGVHAVMGHRPDRSRLPSVWFRMLLPILDRLAPLFQSLGWPRYRGTAGRALQRAGLAGGVTVDHLLAMKVLAMVLTPLVAAQLLEIFSNPALFVLAGVGGFYLPDRLVSDLRQTREAQILKNLPGAVDALALTVEAGLEFLAAMQRLVERGAAGPLRDELMTVLSEIRLGTSRAEALKAFGRRIEIPEVSSFISVLVQADVLGASIGPVLQSQAELMRVERFQRAERAGARASQKILLPLVLFIFPSVLIVILGPVILQFIYG